MNVKNYKTFSLELGLKFAEELNESQIDELFRKLVDIKDFNGLKKISKDESRGTSAKLTSSDNLFRLNIFQTDFSLSFTNRNLSEDITARSEQMVSIFNEIFDTLIDQKFEAMRTNITSYSTNIQDKAYVISEVINEKYQSELDEFDIWLESAGDKIDGIDTVVTTSISNQHSSSMHHAFELSGMEKQLANLIVIHTASGLLDGLTPSSIKSFAEYAMSGKANTLSLEKLGYGQE